MQWRRLRRPGISLALALALASIIASSAVPQPAQAGFYNRTAAVAYADAWSSNTETLRNSEYPAFGNDCTNFVSQVLFAGGYPTNGSGESACYPNEWWKPWLFFVWHWPHSWSVADCQRRLMTNRPGHFQLLPSSEVLTLEGGDVIQIAEDWGPTPTHARITVGPGVDYGTSYWEQQLIDQHTTDRERRKWNINVDPAMPLWTWRVIY